MPSPGRSSLRCESLEARENPSAPVVAESFDAITTPWLPATAWRTWANNGQDYYGVARTVGLSGTQSLASYGNLTVTSYAWNTTAVPADAVVTAAVRESVPAPVVVFTRGRDLASAAASYVGVAVTRGGTVELHEARAGAVRVAQRVAVPASLSGTGWLRLALTVRGDAAEVRVVRADTGYSLTADGRWQAEAAVALRATGLAPAAGTGLAGVGRMPGPYGTAYVDDFAVTPVVRPGPPADIPRNYSHIRIAQLAYTTTPVGDFERTLLRDSVDLVIPHPKFLGTFDQASPDTPQLIYSNVSNLYQDLLTDWLSYADRAGADREAAFYHVAAATPFQGGSPSSQPVTWFWGAYRGLASGGPLTDLTPHARGGRTTGVTFGPAGEALAIGYPDRFREVNVVLNDAADPGWSAAWEYVSRVDAAGAPAEWRPLTLLADGTAGLRAGGRITFDPPADWKPARLPGTPAGLYYVRARTTAGAAETAPTARTLLGRDYVGANGQPRGTIPAFDSAADLDRDGYLNDAEYARRRSGFDARFVSESRLFYPYYGQMRYATNPSAPAVRAWAGDYHTRLLAQHPLADGFFLDNSNGKPPLGGAAVLENGAAFGADYAEMIRVVNRAIAPRWVIANTAGARAEADPVAGAAGAALEEFLLRPLDATWSQVGDAADIVARRLKAADPAPYLVIDSHPVGGSPTDPRTQLATLAYYYLLADPDRTFLMFYGGYSPTAPWSRKWSPAAAVDVGRPTGAMTVFATGADPQNAALTYKVFARTYGNGLVLYKPRSYTSYPRATGTTQDATATTHQLGGSYRTVKADGTLGPVVTSVTLRNGEGAVLVKA